MRPEPYWASADGDVTLLVGDCLDVLRTLPADSVDAIVTDPPAGISFMSREWDDFRRARNPADTGRDNVFGRTSARGPEYGRRDRRQFVEWLTERLSEALRVLKPGGHALVWSIPRTSHWTAWAVEDAGFEVRDCVLHMFGSGFPKSLDVGKAIDRARNDRPDILRVTSWLAGAAEARGIGRAQVDAHMGTSDMGGWWLSRLEHRCAVPTWEQWQQLRGLIGFGDEMDAEVWRLNGRKGMPGEAWDQREVIGTRRRSGAPPQPMWDANAGQEWAETAPATEEAARWDGWGTALKPGQEMWWLARKPLEVGSVAGNVLRYGTGALNIDACKVGSEQRVNNAGGSSSLQRVSRVEAGYRPTVTSSVGEASEVTGRWPANLVLTHSASCDGVCAADCPVGELDRQSGVLTSGANPARRGSDKFRDAYGEFAGQEDCIVHRGANTGGASRFYPVFKYQAKAPASERPRLEDGTAHETVKPLGFISWAVRLVTPPGGTVLDMFAGSGPVAEACIIEGFRAVLIEQNVKSAELIRKRLGKPIQPVMFGLDAS